MFADTGRVSSQGLRHVFRPRGSEPPEGPVSHGRPDLWAPVTRADEGIAGAPAALPNQARAQPEGGFVCVGLRHAAAAVGGRRVQPSRGISARSWCWAPGAMAEELQAPPMMTQPRNAKPEASKCWRP
jgi:hypothetical protein